MLGLIHYVAYCWKKNATHNRTLLIRSSSFLVPRKSSLMWKNRSRYRTLYEFGQVTIGYPERSHSSFPLDKESGTAICFSMPPGHTQKSQCSKLIAAVRSEGSRG